MIKVASYSSFLPPETLWIDTTSRSKNWSRGLSPFFLGPISWYDQSRDQTFESKNVENLWQFSKLYPEHQNADGTPSEAYWDWAQKGWADSYAHRYPMGRGKIPNCAWWCGKALTYVEARKEIYIPYYSMAVKLSSAYQTLLEVVRQTNADGRDVYLRDFDGFDKTDMTWDEVINDPKRKMGHAFVLAMLLEQDLK